MSCLSRVINFALSKVREVDAKAHVCVFGSGNKGTYVCVCPMDNPVIDFGREKEECQNKRANEVERVRFKIEKSVRKLITI